MQRRTFFKTSFVASTALLSSSAIASSTKQPLDKFWNKVVVKMRDVYRAPISDKDEKAATDYLFEHYGNGKL